MLFQVFVQYIEVGQQLHGTRVASRVWQYVNNPALVLPVQTTGFSFFCSYHYRDPTTILLMLLYYWYMFNIPAGDDLQEADAMTSLSCDSPLLFQGNHESYTAYNHD